MRKYLYRNTDTGAELDLDAEDDADAVRLLLVLRQCANVALVGPMPVVQPSKIF